MKEENRFIFVGKTISATKLLDIKIYFLNNNEITKIIYAKSAEYKNNKWLLSDLITSNFGWQDKQINASKEYKWQALTYQKHAQISQSITMPINPKLLQNLNLETRYMGIVDLHRYISFLTQNDLDAEPYRLEFWRKIASPLVIFGMIALVFPLIFGSQRQVSIGQRVFIGIIIGMGFHLLNQIFGNLSVVYNLSPVMGAFLPSIILIVIALVLMTRLR